MALPIYVQGLMPRMLLQRCPWSVLKESESSLVIDTTFILVFSFIACKSTSPMGKQLEHDYVKHVEQCLYVQ